MTAAVKSETSRLSHENGAIRDLLATRGLSAEPDHSSASSKPSTRHDSLFQASDHLDISDSSRDEGASPLIALALSMSPVDGLALDPQLRKPSNAQADQCRARLLGDVKQYEYVDSLDHIWKVR